MWQKLKMCVLYTLICVVCILCSIIALPWMAVCFFKGSGRGWLIAKGFDRVGNAMTGGSDEEYLSKRANDARIAGKRWGCLLCRGLDLIQKGHCDGFTPPQGSLDQ
jgi:hypothetical protein